MSAPHIMPTYQDRHHSVRRQLSSPANLEPADGRWPHLLGRAAAQEAGQPDRGHHRWRRWWRGISRLACPLRMPAPDHRRGHRS